MNKSPITTHVLDTAQGRPAAGVGAVLEQKNGTEWKKVAQGITSSDGRIQDWLNGTLQAGKFRITFDTHSYFRSQNLTSFYPQVTVEFEVKNPSEHFHVPLLLSPWGYSTYRGS